MRGLVGFLIFLMILLIGNIILYASSEEYRFFLKKIKYSEEPVYTDTQTVNDDVQSITQLGDSSSGGNTPTINSAPENLTFLDTLIGANIVDTQGTELLEMTQIEKDFVDRFQTFDLKKLETYTNIFGVTTEYPDPYHEWYSAGVSVYVLSTKTYNEVKNIFEALSFDLPFSLNSVDNFGEKSFYINLEDRYNDNYVRIVMEYENRVFGLKIRKDRYNESKKILDQF